MKRWPFSLLVAICASTPLLAQTVEAPLRAVTDPGVVTTRQGITPAGVQTVFEGRVYGLAFGRTASELWVLTAGGAGTSQLQVYKLDWKSNQTLARLPSEGAPGLQGIQYDRAKDRVLISSVTRSSNKVRLLTSESGALKTVADVLGSFTAGALAHNERVAAVPLIYDNKLAIVNLSDGRIVSSSPTGIAPFGAVINKEGTVAYVSNWGGRVPAPKDLTAPTGLQPNADRVVIDAQGKAATGTVTRLDLASGKATHTIPVELHPTAILWDEARNRLYVANGNKDSVSVIDTVKNEVSNTIVLQPFEKPVRGIAPTALALSEDGNRLYVACGGINAVAVVDVASSKIAGLIPTAWYPNGLSLSPDGSYLAVCTLLGAGSGWQEAKQKRYVHAYRGSVAVIPIPDAGQLNSYATAVAENNHLRLETVPSAEPAPRNVEAVAIPVRAGEPSLIEHVVYIIKENRTYDQVFGDMKKGNGDPSLVMFGEDVTPNHHRLADQFVLLDNFYATGGNSGDGHQWLTQANETAYCLWPGYRGRSYPFDGSDPIAYSEGGFIWDAALKMKKTVRVYGEYAPRLASQGQRLKLLERWRNGESFRGLWKAESPIPPLNGLLARDFPAYSTDIPDVARSRLFREDLKEWERQGSMPNLTILQLPSDHTLGTRPGASTPKAMVADNDLALGEIVEALSKGPFWKKMVILVVEDDAQNGVDHVDGHRTVALAVGPHVRRGYVDSTFYSQTSLLKTIELILGLPSLSLFDLIATDMRASFQSTPDLTPYTAVEPKQSLFEVNPALSALRGPARRAAMDSARMRFDVPDAAPTGRLNEIVWHQIKGWTTRYPGVRQSLFAPLSSDLDDDEREEVEK